MIIIIKKIKNNLWFFLNKFFLLFYSSEFKNKINYIKSFLISIFFGILLSFLIILFNNSDPFLFFKYIFKLSLHPLLKDQTLTYWSIYIIAGLSVAFAFKAGLFNIGVPGQMLFSGGMVIIFGLKNPFISQLPGVIIALFISILSGFLLAFISGILKAFFNIHEVVSTIMLNWIIWFLIKWFFMNNKFGFWDNNRNTTIDIFSKSENFNLILNNQTWIIPFIISIFLIFFLIFIMNFTVFGFRIKMVGKSKNVSLCSGVNVKFYIISAMSISGIISGILGMVFYLTQSTVLQFTTDSLPIIGFDAIAIALVSFSNFLSIIPISFFWAIIKTSAMQVTQLPEFQMSKQIGQLIFGIILYMSSVSAIFLNLNFLFYIKKIFLILKNKEVKKYYYNYNNKIKKINKDIKIINNKENILNKLIFFNKKNKNKSLNLNKENNDKLLFLYKQINLIKSKKNNFINNFYKNYYFNYKKNIKINYINSLLILISDSINKYIKLKNNFFLKKQKINILKNKYFENINFLKYKYNNKILNLKYPYKKIIYNQKIIKKSKISSLIEIKNNKIIELKEKYFKDLLKININNNNKKLKQKILKQMKINLKKINKDFNFEIKKINNFNKLQKKINKDKINLLKNKIQNNKNINKKILFFKKQLFSNLLIIKLKFKKEINNFKIKYNYNLPILKNIINKKINDIIYLTKKQKKILKNKFYIKKNKKGI